ncbi:methyl-accepting chemotaxis protein [Hydrogenophaga crocea]|uniref:Methyl-accepting chemotaxis protein n=1 Tax=Hydrogenophaga crocea TaxID=2716225 RepID=A0A6G8ICJ8_9BURK|nr:methyl-accepting chemotaxis protein [Hydrogenophaga crocea]QIM50821.1 methyl-accepting chemotaxis protein [Hydrogenophaga crocea]
MPLNRKLLLINGILIALLVALSASVWFAMGKVAGDAARINNDNVPALLTIADMELNVTRTSLQLRHGILARDSQERDEALADISTKKVLLAKLLSQLVKDNAAPEDGESVQSLARLLDSFWQEGEANVALIQQGRKEEAFAYLVDRTIPARNALLKPLGEQKLRLSQELSANVEGVRSMATLDRNLVVGAALLITLALTGLAMFLMRITRELGADPHVLKAAADAVAHGDLTIDIPLRPGDTTSVMAALRAMVARLEESVRGVRQSAESVSLASGEIASGNSDLSARTESQASALEETSASTEQLRSAVRSTADNAALVNEAARTANALAGESGQTVAKVVTTMYGIEESSRRIQDIIGVIESIAFQTNILALNAAVEAARAGEQGRGFAVVASEVRSLAQRSATAANEIKQLIEASGERVQQGTDMVAQAQEVMQRMVASISEVSQLVESISLASREQSAGLDQVGQAVSQMDQSTQQNAAMVEQMAAAAANLSTQATGLLETVSTFQLRPNGIGQD